MCDLCFNEPCLNGCPNASEPEPICVCDFCGEEIYEGDEYVSVGDTYCYCTNCATLTVAERDEFDE